LAQLCVVLLRLFASSAVMHPNAKKVGLRAHQSLERQGRMCASAPQVHVRFQYCCSWGELFQRNYRPLCA
jgi:hypothetical protein